LEEITVNGRIILKWLLKEQCVRVWTEFIQLRIGQWWALVKMEMDIGSMKRGRFLSN
jgi:hypothetical protein